MDYEEICKHFELGDLSVIEKKFSRQAIQASIIARKRGAKTHLGNRKANRAKQKASNARAGQKFDSAFGNFQGKHAEAKANPSKKTERNRTRAGERLNRADDNLVSTVRRTGAERKAKNKASRKANLGF